MGRGDKYTTSNGPQRAEGNPPWAYHVQRENDDVSKSKNQYLTKTTRIIEYTAQAWISKVDYDVLTKGERDSGSAPGRLLASCGGDWKRRRDDFRCQELAKTFSGGYRSVDPDG